VVQDYGFTINAENTDTITVNVQARNANREDCAQAVAGRLYLADDSVGLDQVGTAASGGIAVGTDGAFQSLVTGKAGFFTTEADGDLDVAISHSGAKTLYLVMVNPDGSLSVSTAITFV
jgi:hypothetical protein